MQMNDHEHPDELVRMLTDEPRTIAAVRIAQ
jgi:hypothetical protein